MINITRSDFMILLQIGSDDIELISEDDDDIINVNDPTLTPTTNSISQERDTDKLGTKQVTNFISIFLIKLQLTYRLSNNVITAILHFLTALFTFLSKSIPGLTDLIPTSVYNLRCIIYGRI